MMKFLSEEWVDAYKNSLNEDPYFKRVARNWKHDFICVFEDKDKGLLLKIRDGICNDVQIVPTNKEASLYLLGAMASWMKIFQKDSNFFQLVIDKEMEAKGDINIFMNNLPAIKLMTNKMAEIPAEY